MARPPNNLEVLVRMLANLQQSALQLHDNARTPESRAFFLGAAEAYRNVRELALTESEIITIREDRACPPQSTSTI